MRITFVNVVTCFDWIVVVGSRSPLSFSQVFANGSAHHHTPLPLIESVLVVVGARRWLETVLLQSELQCWFRSYGHREMGRFRFDSQSVIVIISWSWSSAHALKVTSTHGSFGSFADVRLEFVAAWTWHCFDGLVQFSPLTHSGDSGLLMQDFLGIVMARSWVVIARSRWPPSHTPTRSWSKRLMHLLILLMRLINKVTKYSLI